MLTLQFFFKALSVLLRGHIICSDLKDFAFYDYHVVFSVLANVQSFQF
jgi:hypothetical protein